MGLPETEVEVPHGSERHEEDDAAGDGKGEDKSNEHTAGEPGHAHLLLFGRNVVQRGVGRRVYGHGPMLTVPPAGEKGEGGLITRSNSTRRIREPMVPFPT